MLPLAPYPRASGVPETRKQNMSEFVAAQLQRKFPINLS
jgi:hypothetical protein